MSDRAPLAQVVPTSHPVMDDLRLHADPVVWSEVSATMRQVEARDSIVFRVGPVGRGWKVAARLVVVAAFLWRIRS